MLIVAGGGSYYYAKKSVNADRAERQEQELKRRKLIYQMEERERLEKLPPKKTRKAKVADHAGSPSGEASEDPAPTRHSPEAAGKDAPAAVEKSKFEPSEPYRSKRGDRFS